MAEKTATERNLRAEIESLGKTDTSDVTTLKAQITGRDEALAAMREQHAATLAERNMAEAELQEQIRQLKQEQSPAADVERLQTELSQARSELSDLRAEHDNAIAERDEARKAVAEYQQAPQPPSDNEVARLTAELQERDEALAGLQAQLASATAVDSTVEDDLRREIRNLRQEVERAVGEAYELREERDGLRDRMTGASSSLPREAADAELTRTVAALTLERDRLAGSLKATRDELASLDINILPEESGPSTLPTS